MPMDPREIARRIEQALPNARVDVQDLVGDGDHLQATVISEAFQGKSLLEQHQMVYQALQGALREQLHALALKTYTPEQWSNKR